MYPNKFLLFVHNCFVNILLAYNNYRHNNLQEFVGLKTWIIVEWVDSTERYCTLLATANTAVYCNEPQQ